MLVFVLLAVAATVRAWPSCFLASTIGFSYSGGQLLTSITLSGGNIGGSAVETARLFPAFEVTLILDAYPRTNMSAQGGVGIVLPESWSDVQYDENTSTINSFVGCRNRVVSHVARSSAVQVPYVSVDGLIDLMSGSAAWSLGSKRILPGTPPSVVAIALTPYFPGLDDWRQYLVPSEGMVKASGCTLHTCVFAGILDNTDVDIIFSMSTAGIGVPASFVDSCSTLQLKGDVNPRFKACAQTRVCRGSLCVPQTYYHGIRNISGLVRPVSADRLVVIGLDPLEIAERDMLIYFTETEMQVGFLYSGLFRWHTRYDQLFIVVILGIMSAVFIERPLVVQLSNTKHQRMLIYVNTVSVTLIVIFMLYSVKMIREGIARSTGYDRLPCDILLVLTMTITLLQFAVCVFANFKFRPTSPARNAVVRLLFPSVLCTVFIMHVCGATERDVQVLVAAVVSLIWLFTVARTLTAVYIAYGPVWIVTIGGILQLLLVPFIVMVGMTTAAGIMDIIGTSNFLTASIYAWLAMLAGIYTAYSSAEAIQIEGVKRQ